MAPAELQAITQDAVALGMTQAQAEKYLTHRLSAQKAEADASQKEMTGRNQAWLGDLQKKWGDKFAENSEHVKRGFEDFDPTGGVRAILKAGHLTNLPVVVEAMERHGRRIAEDKLFAPTAGKTDGNQKLTPEQRIAAGYRETMGGPKSHPQKR